MSNTTGQEYFSLTLNQKNIWNLERAYPGTPMNHISTTIHIEGRIDMNLLEKSINLILALDDTLHTRMTVCEGQPVQYQVPFTKEAFSVYDFTHTNKEGIVEWERALSREPMELLDASLYRFELFRTGDTSGGVFVKLHHLISDGWTQLLICNRISEFYLQFLSGQTPKPEKIPNYRKYIEAEERYFHSAAYHKDRDYWKEMLEKGGTPAMLKHTGSGAVSPVGRRLSFRFPETLNHAVHQFCSAQRTAPFALFYMAIAIYFKRIGLDSYPVIGVPVMNRTNFEFKQSSGMFVSTLPFFCELEDTWSFEKFYEHMMESWYELLRHQRYPYEKMKELQKGEEKDRPLFHIAFSYQNGKVRENTDTLVTFLGRWHYSGYQTEQLCIHLTNMENERQYEVEYDYQTQLFSSEEIRRFHEALGAVLTDALNNPQKPVSSLLMMKQNELEKVLYDFNRSFAYVPKYNLKEALRLVCEAYPDRVALISGNKKLTYGMFYERATRIADNLKRRGAKPNMLMAVYMKKEPLLFELIGAAMISGCAWLLIPEDLPARRIHRILKSSCARILVVKEKKALSGLEKFIDGGGISVYLADELSSSGEVSTENINVEDSGSSSSEDLAYVIYTSGTSGEPKGVKITRKNLLNLVQGMKKIYGHGAVLSVCKTGFDAFVLESAAALLCGQTVVLASDEDCESPGRLAALIKQYGAGFAAMTPSRLSAYMRDPHFEEALRRMECIICGGEAFPAALLNRLKVMALQARIYNQYGPSETTVAVAVKQLNHAKKITIGTPMANCRLYILDAWLNPLPVGVHGELYIGGSCVGSGYIGMEKENNAFFMKSPFEEGERIYKTGDIASWTEDGEVVLYGRKDSQVKVRGQRMELEEIAAVLKESPGIEEAAVLLAGKGNQEYLVGFYTGVKISEMRLRVHLADYLPGYMIPERYIHLSVMPLTPNGKIDEKQLASYMDAQDVENESIEEHTGAYDAKLADAILDIFSESLQTEELTVSSDYFRCGGNSLSAMLVISEVEERWGVKLRINDLYACQSAAGTARYIRNLMGGDMTGENAGDDFVKAPRRESYELTSLQQGMYVQSRLAPDNLSYHMPGAFLIDPETDVWKMEKAFCRVIEEDAIFRTFFVMEGNKVKAKISPQADFSIERLYAADYEEACSHFLRPFLLEQAPLLRAGIWESGQDTKILFLDCHHIIGDGMSTPILIKRLDQAYQQENRVSPKWDYYDCLYNKKDSSKETIEYWKEHLKEYLKDNFKDKAAALEFPCDRKKTGFDFTGDDMQYRFSDRLSRQLDEFCAQRRITPFVLFCSIFSILYARVSGKDRVIFGTPLSGRKSQRELEIPGPFIRTLPLCLEPSGEKKIFEYLEEVKQEVGLLLEHDDITLEELLHMHKIERTPEGNGLYKVMLSMRPFESSKLMLAGKPVTYIPVRTKSAKLDWAVEVAKENGCYELRMEYGACHSPESAVFYARTMEAMAGALIKKKEDAVIGKLPRMDKEDEYRLEEEPGTEFTPYKNMPVHRQIQSMMRRQPEKTAVIWHDTKLSYEELEHLVDKYTLYFYRMGLKKGERVGVTGKRTPMLYAAILALLNNGCTYIPFLTDFPENRIRYMLENAGASRLVCDAASYKELSGKLGQMAINWELADGAIADGVIADGAVSDEVISDQEMPDVSVSGHDLIHILYTSGSTGNPKGVMVEHHSISNLTAVSGKWYRDITGPMAAVTTITFDIFASECLIPLALGKTIVLADEQEMLLPWKTARLISEYHCEFVQFTASRLWMCLQNEAFCDAARGLKFTIVGGESVSEELVDSFYKHCDGRLVNLYGPTEACVYATMKVLKKGETVTIGKPLPNYRIYLLDQKGEPVMPTASGEICIAGQGVTSGYVGRPDLTELVFVQDPFFPDERMYRSGDMGRMMVDGDIEYLGRIDSQIKINGQRVELGEIESCMRKSELTFHAVVLPVNNSDGSCWLCGFYVSDEDSRVSMEEYLKSQLPSYMVPAKLIYIAKMPLTNGGKTDRQKLFSMLAHDSEKEQPDDDTKEMLPTDKLENIWKETLGVTTVDEETSFFEQGGTSLGALNVLSQYFNEKIEMTMEQFYHNPTLRSQRKLLGLGKKPEEVTKKACESRYPHRIPESGIIREEPEKTVFFTGATGYFGAHLLKEIIENTVSVHVYCLTRGGEEHLFESLSWYFGEGWTAAHRTQIEAVEGTLEKTYLGLSKEYYCSLARKCGAVYHCAADVRHYVAKKETMDAVNVQGTKQMIQFALEGNIPLHAMSTVSVSGNLRDDGTQKECIHFHEWDFDIGQNWQENVYVRSKFLAEAAIYQAMEEHKLKAHVYRLGLLTRRSSDGVFQKNADLNAAWLLVKAAKELGYLPQKMCGMKTDQMPVDVAAKIVWRLGNSPMTAFHVMNPDPPRLIDIMKTFLPDIKEVSDGEFEEIIRKEGKVRDRMLLAPLMDRWNQLKKGNNHIQAECEETYRELERLGGGNVDIGSGGTGILH